METSTAVLGETLRKFRLRKGLTQEGLSEIVGIHYTFLGHIERGNKLPSLPTLSKLAQALGKPMSTLVKGFNPPA